jgi:hypothetical protein
LLGGCESQISEKSSTVKNTETVASTSAKSTENQKTKAPAITNRRTTFLPTNLFIDRKDFSLKNEKNDILAIIFFDLVQMKGDSKASKKFNAFMVNEYLMWKESSGKLNLFDSEALLRFHDHVADMRAAYGDEDLVKSPLQYSVTANVMYSDKDCVSITETVFWSAGGSSNYNTFGYTFSTKTGELLPFTHFTNIEADAFKSSLYSFLIPNYKNALFYLDHDEENMQVKLTANPEHDFSFGFDDHTYDLSYEYYFDGKDICLTLIGFGKSNPICKWNGKTGRDFRGTLWSYYLNEETVIEVFVPPE